MTLFLCLLSLLICIKSDSFDLSSNPYVEYEYSPLCPRTSWCLKLNSSAQVWGGGEWQKYLWPSNFSITFWYYSRLNGNNDGTKMHNIISNCNSTGLVSNKTTFLFATQTEMGSTKTSHFEVYFNTPQCDQMINNNKTQCYTQNVIINNEWQHFVIIYDSKKGFFIYSNGSLWSNNITWSKQRNVKSSNNVLCIGDGEGISNNNNNNNNNNNIELLTDIRFYNRSIDISTINHLYDLKYNLTDKDNEGIFAYFDFKNKSTKNNMLSSLCLELFYIDNISPKSISLAGGDTIYLYGHLLQNANNTNINIELINNNNKYKLGIPSSSINIINITCLSFNIPHSIPIDQCTDKLYISIWSDINNCCYYFNNMSIATYSPTFNILIEQLPAINNINVTAKSDCFPPNDNGLHCYLYLNDYKRDVSAYIINRNTIICKFPDLSSLSPSTNYKLKIISLKYGYLTNPTIITIYGTPSIKQLSQTTFQDNQQQIILNITGDNFIYNQPFQCNFIDPKQPHKLIYHSKGEININENKMDIISCLISTNLISPSINYKFYLSSNTYFNSSKIPIIIENCMPCLQHSIFDDFDAIYPSSSFQFFFTQIVDCGYNNYSFTPNGYQFNMISMNCPSIQFIYIDLRNGILNWSYTAPPAFTPNNFSCKVNFTASQYHQNKIVSFMIFDIQFMTINPSILSLNNTLFLRNNITNFVVKLKHLYIDDTSFYYQNSILSNNISIQCVFTNAINNDIKYEFIAILIDNDKYNNIQTVQCPNVIISDIGQYIFQFKMTQFDVAYITPPYNHSNKILYTYNLPLFNKENINLSSSQHIYIHGNNFQIGQNALNINQWKLKCSFGTEYISDGCVINDTLIFCIMPNINLLSLNDVLSISITYISYSDSFNNIYSSFSPILLLTNLSLSFMTKCPSNCNNNGYCDYQGICHCSIGYSGDRCQTPLYYIIASISSIVFIIIILILIYFCRKYQNKYRKLLLQNKKQYIAKFKNKNNNNNNNYKYFGYKPIEDDDEDICCCCFNLTTGHYGYYICCQFCCCCDERTTKIKLPTEEDTYTSSTFVANQQNQQKLYNKSHLYVDADINHDQNHNHDDNDNDNKQQFD